MKKVGAKKKFEAGIRFAEQYNQKHPEVFTDREREIMRLYLIKDKQTVCHELGIVPRTLYETIYRILAKVGIETEASKWPSRKKMRDFINQYKEREKI